MRRPASRVACDDAGGQFTGGGITRNIPGIAGSAEPGDRFGAALAWTKGGYTGVHGVYQERAILSMCDLDHFKDVRDTLGHAAGDHVLLEFAAAAWTTLRSSDYCARYGGEGFALILPGCTGSQARALLTRLDDSGCR